MTGADGRRGDDRAAPRPGSADGGGPAAGGPAGGPPRTRRDPSRIVALRAQIACLVELAAPNPGNVRPGRDLPGLRAVDLMTSAAAVGPAMAAAGRVPLGETVLRAVEETRRWVDTNTNLGIVLLLAPLARAALRAPPPRTDDDGPGASEERSASRGVAADVGDADAGDLWASLEAVLASTTVRDAELAYRAIRRAEPGGLGRVDEQDVSGRPTVPLREAMRRAADRDAVAEQYATGYRLLQTRAVPAVLAARRRGADWTAAAHRCFVELLARRPDSLLARKFGREEADEIRREARRLLDREAEGGPAPAPDAGEAGWEELDRRLRSADPPRNPGTTADLTAAALFAALLVEAGWNSPGDGQ